MLPFLSIRIRMEQSKYHQGEKANIYGVVFQEVIVAPSFSYCLFIYWITAWFWSRADVFMHMSFTIFFLDFCRTKNCLIIFQFISTFSSITIFVNSLVSISNSLRESCGYNLFFRYDWLLHYKWCYAVQKRWGNCCCYCPWAWTLEAQPYCVHLHCYAGLCNSIPELKWIESE